MLRAPDHLVLTLRSTNELHLENVPDPTMADELSEEILPIWPHGVNTQENRRGKWKVEYAGHPWACHGIDAILYVIIVVLCSAGMTVDVMLLPAQGG